MKAPRLFLFQIGGEKMPYIPPEVVAKAREMDLLTYLKNYEPHELVHFGGNTYCTREHDSLKISNGKWCWFSRGIGGYSALDYLIKVKEIPFTEAVEMIMGRAAVSPPVFTPRPKEEKPKVLLLPKVDRCATHAVEYLHRRGIDYGLIEFCISTGRLYESTPYHNVVFVGMDSSGKARYANLRGIGSDFIGDANGSDKHYSFGIPAAAKSDRLHLFESAVDLLSYGTLLKLYGKDWRRDNLLSLAGVYRPKKEISESTLPAALVRYLDEYPHIRKVVLRLDNDLTGKLAAETIKTLLPRKYAVEVAVRLSPQGKDYNDCLCLKLGLPITKRKEKTRERFAQYESGARTPKRNLLCRMARVLGVSPSALAVPRIKNSEELYCLLRALEDECGIKLSPQSDTAAAIYESHRERSKEQ